MSAKNVSGASGWVDPDDAPELDQAFFDRAEIREGEKVIKRGGRPRLERPKGSVSIRLDTGVLEAWRASGPGWQTRMQEVLTKAAPKARAAGGQR